MRRCAACRRGAVEYGSAVSLCPSIENIPAGWQARETSTRIGADEVDERFELAEPGKEYALYSRTRLKRIRR